MILTDTTESQFLQSILLDPSDDMPRLILADHLIEFGGYVTCGTCQGRGRVIESRGSFLFSDTPVKCPTCQGSGEVSDGRRERGEFIRAQCELAKPCEKEIGCGRSRSDPNYLCSFHKKLKNREMELFAELVSGWTDEDIRMFGIGSIPQMLRSRGFVSEIRLPCDDFMRHAAAIFRCQPVTRVVLTDKRPLRASPDGYHWFMDETPSHWGSPESKLPWPLFRQIKLVPSGQWSKSIHTEQLALDALSVACVRLGRRRAGLEK